MVYDVKFKVKVILNKLEVPMKNLLTIVAFHLASLALVASAHPSRFRILVHGGIELSPRVGLSTRVLPGPNLVQGVAPVAFLELNLKVAKWLDISPTIGWATKPNEAIASLVLHPHLGKFWAWLDFEYQPQSQSGYWFGQVQYKVLPWLEVGFEEESWGSLADFSGFSHGGGPNALFHLGKNFGLDVALHVRDMNGQLGEELFLRAHVFL